VRNASIIRVMMQIVRASETSANFNETTRRYIPEGYRLQRLWVQKKIQTSTSNRGGISYFGVFIKDVLLELVHHLTIYQHTKLNGLT
jgi:hypothetical protein